jgi:hypothetical protein
MHLIFAAVWTAVGIGILTWQYSSGSEALTIDLFGLHFSCGYLALFLALYNVVRWYSRRSSQATAKALADARAERERARRQDEGKPIDPTFDFSDRPPDPGPPPG